MSERPDSIHTDDGGTTYSRRTVLRAGGAAVGTVATSGVAAAQNETGTNETTNGTATDDTPTPSPIITMAVTLEQEDVEGDLTGMWIHVGRPVKPTQAAIADECDIVDWGDQDTLAYSVKLIDRRAEPYQQSITLYLPRRAQVGPGDLFIINREVPCRSGYIGVELEQIGARNVDAGIKSGKGLQTEYPTETEAARQAGDTVESGSGVGLGLGLFATVGGLLGGGWLLGRDRED